MNTNIIPDEGNVEKEYEYFKKLLAKYNLPSFNMDTYRAIRASSIQQIKTAASQTPLLDTADIILIAVLSEDIIRFKQTL